ncbi:methyltransferase RsmF C-terminal domain-like protein [Stieleria marina]|uniref:Ribosomal RNA small subunit methyltransferase F n=1 Tax=Stieleria marina TaxID=1930275 RepID=A0A517P2P6_9BACT|nr:Ribosomal RNA small subunit methyltransferase F [Planctomycetes bacterium K23_9]
MKRPPGESISEQAVVNALGPLTLPGSELDQFMASLGQRHRSVLRVRRDRADQSLPYETDPVSWYSLGHQLINENDRPSRHILYAAGDYYLQDAGSLLALAACGADRSDLAGLKVCDLCAAPGGKASGLLEAVSDTGFLLANEPIRSRIAPLAFNLARTGSNRYAISCSDPDDLASALAGQFDIVLVDAPCSGQALMARGKQSMSALSEKQIVHSAARQERILDAALRLLRPGGRLIYSTCTFAVAENEAQIDRLVERQVAAPCPVDRLANYASGEATYRLWPHRHRCAGSFAASVVALESHSLDADIESNLISGSSRKSKKKKDRDKDDMRVLKSLPLDEWYGDGVAEGRLKVTDSVIYGWPSDTPDWVTQIAMDGPELSHRTGQTWKPAHAGALRSSSSPMAVDVDAATAAQYLSGGTITCATKGWHVVRYNDRPLGWVKSSGGTGKNHLPTSARFNGVLDH